MSDLLPNLALPRSNHQPVNCHVEKSKTHGLVEDSKTVAAHKTVSVAPGKASFCHARCVEWSGNEEETCGRGSRRGRETRAEHVGSPAPNMVGRPAASFHERNLTIGREFLWLATSGRVRSAEFADRRRNEGQIPPVQ